MFVTISIAAFEFPICVPAFTEGVFCCCGVQMLGFEISLPLDKGACVAVLCDCTVETLLTPIPVNRLKSEVGWVVLQFGTSQVPIG